MVQRRPAQSSGPCVLVVPPFAEEMNKCRRMIAEAANALAALGVAALVPDLFGTGDSEGEFRDADWETWKADLDTAVAWASEEGWPVKGVLAIRLGGVLAAEWLRERHHQLERAVLWQPVESGNAFLTQFLRLRVAASMMESRRETVGELRKKLSEGETLEVAGYELSGRLATQLDAAQLLDHLGALAKEITCFDVGPDSAPAQSPRVKRLSERAAACGTRWTAEQLSGEPYWTSTEIVALPKLVEKSAAVFGASL